MQKPLVIPEDVAFTNIEENGYYSSKRAQFSAGIGARKLGYNLTELPPGKAQCPFHAHRVEEETFLILEGEGELRFGDQRYPLRKHDVIAYPTGGAEVAHQIIKTGRSTMRYLALSSLAEVEICEYPDSDKLGVYADGSPALRKMFLADTGVEYYERESMQPPPAGPALALTPPSPPVVPCASPPRAPPG